jgi:hypothetical protein
MQIQSLPFFQLNYPGPVASDYTTPGQGPCGAVRLRFRPP